MTDHRVYVDGVFDNVRLRNSNDIGTMKRSSFKLPLLGLVGDYQVAKNTTGGNVFIAIFIFNQKTYGISEGEVTIKTATSTAGPSPVFFSDVSSVGDNSIVPRQQTGFGVQTSGSIFEGGEIIWKANSPLYIQVKSGDATGVTGYLDLIYFSA